MKVQPAGAEDVPESEEVKDVVEDDVVDVEEFEDYTATTASFRQAVKAAGSEGGRSNSNRCGHYDEGCVPSLM